MDSSVKNKELTKIKNCSENILPKGIDESLKSILKHYKFINSKIDWRSVLARCSYMGNLYEVDISGKTEEEDKELHLFVKHIVDGSKVKIFSVIQWYKKELYFYKEVSRVFAELQEEANVPIEERYKTVHSYEESNQDMIIMDNVSRKGFNVIDGPELVLPLIYYEIAVKELAKFHALSFVLKEKRPLDFDEIKSIYINDPYIFGKDWDEVMNSLREDGLKNVDDEFKTKLNKVYDDTMSKFCQYRSDESIKVCLVHGDYRFSNIMMSNNEREQLQMIPIDYQLMHYGCPIFDFLYFIFVCTNKKFRKDNLLYLKALYHETLGNFLKYFDLDIEFVYPRNEFERVYKEKLDYGLMLAVLTIPFNLARGDNKPEMNKSEWKFEYNKEVKNLYKDVIEDFIEWGYL